MGRTMTASRAAWILSNGAIPNRKHVLHRCDNPPCINPAHLFLGTHQDNMDDMARKNRKPSKLTLADVKAIRESRSTSATLARQYGVAERTIRYARNPNTWLPAPPDAEGKDVEK